MDGLAGVNLAVQTPFKDDGSIDYHRWEALLDVYADSGVHGILLSSGTGQHAYLTEAECNELFRTGVRRINGRTRILCQTSALNLEEVIRRSKTAEALGAEAVLILPPFFEGPTHDDGIFAFYERIDRELGIDVIGYNIPQATNITLTPKLYHRLLSLKNFKYIKESSGNLTRQQALIQTGGRVLNGADCNTVFSLLAGCQGVIWGGANIFPVAAAQLYRLTSTGAYDEALQLWKFMFPVLNYCWENDYIPAVKAAARIMGYEGGSVRAPVCPLDQDAEHVVAGLLAPFRERFCA
jgi:4-hydroxy-tetrahydrodipicolinate synthase